MDSAIGDDFTVRNAVWEIDHTAIRHVRHTVFVQEQNVPEHLELDGSDQDCYHVLATDVTGQPIGTARMQRHGHIGRVAVLKEWRGRGVGRGLVCGLIETARSHGLPQVDLNSQLHATPFYARLDFRPEGNVFHEADIPHVRMVKNLD